MYFTVMPAQAMQYASTKAIWNLLFGVNQPSFEQNKGNKTINLGISMIFSSATCLFLLLLFFFYSFFASFFSYSCRFTWDNEHVHIWTVVQLIIMFSLHHSYSRSDDNHKLTAFIDSRGIKKWKNPTICKVYIWLRNQVGKFSTSHFMYNLHYSLINFCLSCFSLYISLLLLL